MVSYQKVDSEMQPAPHHGSAAAGELRRKSARPRTGLAVTLGLLVASCTFHLDDVRSVETKDAGADAAGGAGGTNGDGSVPWPTSDATPDGVHGEVAPDASPIDASDADGGSEAGGSGGGPPATLTVLPATGLAGDGFLASPDLCGQQVWDYYSQSAYKAIHVGRDIPCGGVATYRAFLRFSLEQVAGTAPSEVMLRFSYAGKTDPSVGVRLFEVEDFVSLQVGDWSLAHRHDHGPVLDPSTAPGWIEVDVTQGVTLALAQGETAIAFKLQYETESEDANGKSRWYGIRAANDGIDTAPQLLVTY